MGAVHNARVQDSALGTPTNTHYENNVAINSGSVGFYIRTSYNTTGTNNTAIGAAMTGFVWDRESTNGSPGRTFFFDNTLSINNGKYGTYSVHQTGWLLNYVNSYNNPSLNFYPSSDANRTNSKTVNPNLGGCKVWIPAGSPMKGAGKNGRDIGANILYLYQNGVLTSTPFWTRADGSFPHGALVAGLNDIAGASAFDLHKRLSVNTNGCSFPVGYGK
jgi:parallel beta-helix repeat protein